VAAVNDDSWDIPMLGEIAVWFDQRGTGKKTKLRIHMNRLRNIVGLIAVCATAAFFTACDEKDTTSNNGTTSNAPDALASKTYNLTDAAGTSVLAFDANNNYTLTPSGGGTAEAGTFTANRSGDVWAVTTTDATGTNSNQLTLTFGAPGSGTYTLERPGQPVVNGSFAEAGTGSTTTDGGSTTTTTTGVTAPAAAPASINVVTGNADSGVGAGATYTVVTQGGTSGTFQITNSGSNGTGTYTYTKTSASEADLVLTYSGNFQGDIDRMHLIFTKEAGSNQPNQYTGTQRVTNVEYPFSGTFTY
jgi:hypothetical protein